MKDLLPRIMQWTAEKKPFALVRVIQTWGSSPRPVGSAMIVSVDKEMAGSVSGGCVEGAVMKEAVNSITNQSGKLVSYGVSDEEAWTVGLTCGGKIQVYVQAFPGEGSGQFAIWKKLTDLLQSNESCLLITSLANGESVLVDSFNTVTGKGVSVETIEKARQWLASGKSELVTVGETDYFIQAFPKRSLLLLIGAAHITAELVPLARSYDFETIVIDPRRVFANNLKLAEQPDQIIEKYPSEVLRDFALDDCTYAVILSHDPKIDDDALRILLKSRVKYIGALGSRKTHEKRVERLRDGFSPEEINRIESPIGVDINAQGAKEISLSIMGSLIRTRNKV